MRFWRNVCRIVTGIKITNKCLDVIHNAWIDGINRRNSITVYRELSLSKRQQSWLHGRKGSQSFSTFPTPSSAPSPHHSVCPSLPSLLHLSPPYLCPIPSLATNLPFTYLSPPSLSPFFYLSPFLTPSVPCPPLHTTPCYSLSLFALEPLEGV